MERNQNIISGRVVVPTNFVGSCCGDLLKVPSTLTTQVARSWDYEGTNGFTHSAIMTEINTSAGVYDWSTFDQFFSNSTDKDLIFVLGTPPDYLVSGSAIGGSYRGTKGNMCPTDLTGWATAVTAVVSRAKDTHGRTGIKWELWNEFDQSSCYADTISLLGPYTKATYQAIKAVDPTAIVLSPSLSGANATALAAGKSYITASDGAGSTSASWLDGLAFHYYVTVLAQVTAIDNPIDYVNAYSNFQGMMKENGANLPIWITESGCLTTDTLRWRHYQHRLLVWAALGARCVLLYAYDAPAHLVSTFESQINEVSALLANNAVITRLEVGMTKVTIEINNRTYVY